MIESKKMGRPKPGRAFLDGLMGNPTEEAGPTATANSPAARANTTATRLIADLQLLGGVVREPQDAQRLLEMSAEIQEIAGRVAKPTPQPMPTTPGGETQI